MASVPGKQGPEGPEPTLAEAIDALARAIAPKPVPAGGSGLGRFLKGLAETVLPSVLMFALGYVFIQGVELDLKREAFTASAADKLKTYVESLLTSTPDTPLVKLQATALALGGFGGVAAYPLISIVESGDARRITAAKAGLEQAGRIAPGATCDALVAVVDDPTGTYAWRTRKAVAEVAGLVGCAHARKPLERLRGSIATMEGLTTEQRSNYEAAIEAALARIEAATRRRSG